MKKKRIQYNELNEEIYTPNYWSKNKLIFTGIIIIILGFLFNFSLEEKINKGLQAALSNNEACPILFDKAELSYFLPKINIKKPVILGACFGQPNNKLSLNNLKIALSGPSFYPPGIKFHFSIYEDKTNINFFPIISLFSQTIDIEDTVIDSQLFSAMTVENKSPIAGLIKIEGFFKYSSGAIEDGKLLMTSTDLSIPAQNFKGYEMSKMSLKHLSIKTHFTNKTTMQIDHIEVGKSNSPLELKLKGNLLISPVGLGASQLQLSGPLHLTPLILQNFSFIKLFLPEGNTSGTYQMRLMGPLGNLSAPQFN